MARSEMRTPSSGGGGSSGCFPAGTLVKTTDGPRDVATLREGDLIVTLDQRRGTEVSCRVLKVARYRNTVWQITFADGHQIRTTASHSLLVNGVWQTAGQVKSGDRLLCVSDTGEALTREVVRSAASGEARDVFNLVVRGSFTFVADGVLAHSFTHFRTLRILGWTGYAVVCDAWRPVEGLLRRGSVAQEEPPQCAEIT